MFPSKKCTGKLCPDLVESGLLLSFHFPLLYDTILSKEDYKMQTNTRELRKKYINNPPEGFTSKDIRSMSDEELLDMDYFMNEELDDDFGEEGFYIF